MGARTFAVGAFLRGEGLRGCVCTDRMGLVCLRARGYAGRFYRRMTKIKNTAVGGGAL